MSLVERALKKIQSSSGQRPVVPSPLASADAGASLGTRPPAPVKPRRAVHLDRVALRAAGLLPPDHQERQIADQYRQIKRPLVTIAQRDAAQGAANPRLVMVTSAMPGDGKTFTSLNLALSLAKERDTRVLLMDADVSKPHVSRLFGVEGEPGLLDTLRDSAVDPESLVMPVDVQGLSIMPAGRRSDTATELLASQRMHAVCDSLLAREPSRVVVIDSPPLLLTNESRVLATTVGQVVVVVRAGKTSQQNLLAALGFLDARRHAIGLVLNQSMNPSTSYSYYGYGDNEPGSSVAS